MEGNLRYEPSYQYLLGFLNPVFRYSTRLKFSFKHSIPSPEFIQNKEILSGKRGFSLTVKAATLIFISGLVWLFHLLNKGN